MTASPEAKQATRSQTGELVYLAGPKDLEFREYPIPVPTPNAVVTEVERTNVCGSDLHVWRGDHPLSNCGLGHEAVCRVSQMGADRTSDSAGTPIEVGDLVAPVYFQTCQECSFCRRGEFYRCANDYEYAGASPETWPHFHTTWASHYYIHPNQHFYKVPETISDTPGVAAAANCALAQVLFGLDRVGIEYGNTVVIQGAGGLGLFATAYANECGADPIVIDGVKNRIERARSFGAEHVIDLREYKTVSARAERVSELTDGLGADIGVEVAGTPAAFAEGIELLRTGGQYLVMGNVRLGHTIDFDPGKLVRKSIDVTAAVEYNPWMLYDALDFLARTINQYPYDTLIDEAYPLSEVSMALEHSANRDLIRATLVPAAD